MKVTETLSPAALQDNTPEISDRKTNFFVHFVMSSFPINEKTRQKLVTELAKDDDTIRKLRHQISAGWPEHRLKLNPCLRPYYHHNSMITYQDRFVLKGPQIIEISTHRYEMHKATWELLKTK